MNNYIVFNAYPTYICDKDIILSLSENGKELYYEKKEMLSNGNLDDIFFETEIYKSILELIAQKEKINLFLLTESLNDYSPDVVKRYVVMLIKRGYLNVE